MDATKSGGKGRLINHSKKAANVKVKVVEVDGKPRLAMIAARKLHVGEELLYDYGERKKDIVKENPWLKE